MDSRPTNTRPSFDRRPLALVLLERNWRWVVYAALAMLLVNSTGDPWAQGLDPKAQRALAIFMVCIVLWVFNLLPLMITSILALVLPPIMGVMPAQEAYSLFGNKVIFFLLGAFILAAALSRSGLAERITLTALRLSGGSPRRLSIGIYVTGAVLSTVMSEHAVAALLFPIVLELCRVMELEPRRSSLGRLLFLSMAWGCISGGVITLLGGARGPLALGILFQTTGTSIGFFEWVLDLLPASLLTLGAGYGLLALFFPIEKTQAAPAEEFLRKRERKLGRLSVRELAVGAIMAATIYSWVMFEHVLGLAEVSLLAVVALFALRLINWREVEESVNWGVVLMYGGAVALGFTLSKSGAAHWLAESLLQGSSPSPFALIALLAVLTILLTEAVSNAAVVSVLMPLGLALAEPLSVDPKAVTYAIAYVSGLPHVLPMGTPALALAFSSGYLRVRHSVVAGLAFNLVLLVIFLIMVKFYWPLMNMGSF